MASVIRVGSPEWATALLVPQAAASSSTPVHLPPLAPLAARRARARLRQAIVHVIAAARLEHSLAVGAEPPPRPQLQLAREYVRFLLPKGDDGQLLSLCCPEAQFGAHVGAGVSTYMRFVRLTCGMFGIATLITIPQYLANYRGSGLGLASPWSSEGRCADAYAEAARNGPLAQVLAHVTGIAAWLLYGSMLGNADLGSTPPVLAAQDSMLHETRLGCLGGRLDGMPADPPAHGAQPAAAAPFGAASVPTCGGGWEGAAHLWSELALASYFCVYALYVFRRHRRALANIESSSGARASDFAVHVVGLPETGATPASVRAHFRFFGPVASVALSRDERRVVAGLLELRGLRREWRHLHAEYARADAALRPARPGSNLLRSMEAASARQAKRTLLRRMEATLRSLLLCGSRLRAAAAEPSPCTGHAFVVFSTAAAAARCTRHFGAIRRHSAAVGLGGGQSVDFRHMYWNETFKLEVCRAPEPSDIIWESLPTSPAVAFGRRLRTTLLLLLVSCLSTMLIVLANQFATLHSVGVLTTLWTTPLIIASNVLIFALTPALSLAFDSHQARSSQHLHMLLKMVFFQCLNTIVSCSSFFYVPWPAQEANGTHCPRPPVPALPPGESCSPEGGWDLGKPSLACVRHWYVSGAVALLNALVGDLFAILLLIELVMHGGPDKLLARHVLARRARTQAEMNAAYAIESDMYLPFRWARRPTRPLGRTPLPRFPLCPPPRPAYFTLVAHLAPPTSSAPARARRFSLIVWSQISALPVWLDIMLMGSQPFSRPTSLSRWQADQHHPSSRSLGAAGLPACSPVWGLHPGRAPAPPCLSLPVHIIPSDPYGRPGRYNLVLKVTLLAIAFCPAIPLLLPFACVFLALSYAIDRYNLLRVLNPPPRTSDRAVTTSVLYILPIACCAHVFYALFFYSRQAGADAASLYYVAIFAVGALVLWRLTIALRRPADTHAPPPNLCEEEPPQHHRLAGEGRRVGGLLSHHHLPHVLPRLPHRRRAAAQADESGGTMRVDETAPMYLPPLTSTLLGSAWLDHESQGSMRERQSPSLEPLGAQPPPHTPVRVETAANCCVTAATTTHSEPGLFLRTQSEALEHADTGECATGAPQAARRLPCAPLLGTQIEAGGGVLFPRTASEG